VDEARPGNYVFYDWMQAAVGVCGPEEVAVSVLASVVSHQAGGRHVIVDAGALAMSKDPGPAHPDLARGFGPAYRCLAGAELESRLSLVAVSQEHGFLGGPSPDDVRDRYRVGEKVRIMPNHSCLTAAMFDQYWVVRGEEVVDRWQIRRGR
jgi:D-serine deaminase-like pyridoxal phosphate-dependent protein